MHDQIGITADGGSKVRGRYGCVSASPKWPMLVGLVNRLRHGAHDEGFDERALRRVADAPRDRLQVAGGDGLGDARIDAECAQWVEVSRSSFSASG